MMKILSSKERIHQWNNDVAVCGNPEKGISSAKFNHSTLGIIRWWKNSDGTYTRHDGENEQRYEGKQKSYSSALSVKRDGGYLIRHLAQGYQGDYDYHQWGSGDLFEDGEY